MVHQAILKLFQINPNEKNIKATIQIAIRFLCLFTKGNINNAKLVI